MSKKLLRDNKLRKAVVGEKESDQVKVDLGNAQALKILNDSEGGQLLIESLSHDVLGAIEALCINPQSISHIEFVSFAVRIKERLEILQTMTGANGRQQLLREILAKLLEQEAEIET